MTEPGVEIPITMTPEEAEAALQRLEQMARSAGREIRSGVGEQSREGGERAPSGFGSLAEKLQAYRREESQQTRTIRFLTGQLQEMLPIGNQAASTLGKVGTILAGGIGWGLAFEGVKLAIGAIVDGINEAEEAAKALAQAARDNEDLWYRVANARAAGLAAIGATPQSEIDKQVESATATIRKEIEDKREELRKLDQDIDQTLRDRDWDEAGELLKKKFALQETVQELRAEEVAERDVARARAEAAAEQASSTATAQTYYQTMMALGQQFRAQAKQLSRDAVLASMDERERIQEQLRLQIEDLRAFGQDETSTREAIAAARRISNEKLRALDFKEAKAAADRQREAELVWLEAEFAAEDQRDALMARALAGTRQGKLQAVDEEQARMSEGLQLAHARNLLSDEEYERSRTDLARTYAEQRRAILEGEATVQRQVDEMIRGSVQNLAAGFGASFGRMVNHAGRYNAAMREAGKASKASASEVAGAVLAQVQAVMAGLAQESATRALFETAMGLADLARSFWDPTAGKSAAGHFAAAAQFGVVAGIAGAGAYAIGSRRPMTQDERESLANATASGAGGGGSSGGAREASGGSDVRGAGGTIRETIIVIGDPFETPQETARRAARRIQLAQRLDMLSPG